MDIDKPGTPQYAQGRRRGWPQLFLLRVWQEETDEEEPRLCGKVQRVLSPEGHRFEDGRTLLDLIVAMLPPPEAASPNKAPRQSEDDV